MIIVSKEWIIRLKQWKLLRVKNIFKKDPTNYYFELITKPYESLTIISRYRYSRNKWNNIPFHLNNNKHVFLGDGRPTFLHRCDSSLRDCYPPQWCNISATFCFANLKRTIPSHIPFINSSFLFEKWASSIARKRERWWREQGSIYLLIKIFFLSSLSVLSFSRGFRFSEMGDASTHRNQHTEIAIRICFFSPPPQVLPEFWRRQSSFHENLLRRLTLT